MLELPNKNHIYGFKTYSPKVTIFKNGLPFYNRTNRDGVLYFNMPSGNYDVLAGQIETAHPVFYPTLNLDKRNNFDNVEKLRIIVAPNINKATIDLGKLIAIIDPKLATESEYKIKYVIGHEYAHNLYRGLGQKSEIACDKLACDIMLKIGFNPNQCIAAIRGTLSNSPLALIRKREILNELNKIKNGIIRK